MESSRLPGKVLQDLGGYSTIEMVLKRTSLSKLIDQVCVASPKTLANERLAKHVESLGYRIFFGSEHNVLERYYKTAKQLNAKVILENNQSVNIKMLVSLIHGAKFIIANDTGPAHIASHLDKKGLVLFGSHTSAKKVSIENFNFKALTVQNLEDLNVETVLNEIQSRLN